MFLINERVFFVDKLWHTEYYQLFNVKAIPVEIDVMGRRAYFYFCPNKKMMNG